MSKFLKTKMNEIELKILFPMIEILNKKNITNGITTIYENDKIYICFDKNYLSETNRLIIEKISFIYSDTFFYTDNATSPNSDRLEYWCPYEYYDNEKNIEKEKKLIEKIRNKKLIALELDIFDAFTILGTSIMLANTLQEQDPLKLKIYQNETILDKDLLERHEHYISNGRPDSKWLSLYVSLNNDNPLYQNMYAPFMTTCEINSPVITDNDMDSSVAEYEETTYNVIASTIEGYDEKTYLEFTMKKEVLHNAIMEYLTNSKDHELQDSNNLNEEFKKLLTINHPIN